MIKLMREPLSVRVEENSQNRRRGAVRGNSLANLERHAMRVTRPGLVGKRFVIERINLSTRVAEKLSRPIHELLAARVQLRVLRRVRRIEARLRTIRRRFRSGGLLHALEDCFR